MEKQKSTDTCKFGQYLENENHCSINGKCTCEDSDGCPMPSKCSTFLKYKEGKLK